MEVLAMSRDSAKTNQTFFAGETAELVRVLQCLNWYCFKTHSAVHK